jgi:hypothetical protein
MDEDLQDDELTIEELIQLELAGIESVIEAVPDGPPVFFNFGISWRFC